MDLSLQKLEQAISIRKRIHQLEGQLSALFSNKGPRSSSKTNKVSRATRAKLSAAGKARWAKRNGAKSGGNSNKRRSNSGLTPAGRRKLSQLMKARWAARRKIAANKK
jgi:hypothetical protein